MARGRKRRDHGGGESAAPSGPRHIEITAKKVGGVHNKGDLLVVGRDVSREIAESLIEKGRAIDVTDKAPDQIKEERNEAQARNQMVLQKQRSEQEMIRHDRLPLEERERAYYQDPEEGADIDEPEDPIRH